jgi:chromosome partitioning protein
MTIIAISNQKGGVGKTTTTMNLGAALAEQGKRVLLVDLDQQGSLTHSAGYDPDNFEETIYTILASYADMRQRNPRPITAVIQHIGTNLDLVPANGELAAIDLEIERAIQREHILRRALAVVQSGYDYILLDCPPSLSLLVVNALNAADNVIIPLQADYLATKGVKRLLEIIETVQARLNPTLRIDGILLTMADQRTAHAREVIQSTRAKFNSQLKVFTTVIKQSVRLKESPISGRSILQYDPTSEAAAAYRQLAKEVINNG